MRRLFILKPLLTPTGWTTRPHWRYFGSIVRAERLRTRPWNSWPDPATRWLTLPGSDRRTWPATAAPDSADR